MQRYAKNLNRNDDGQKKTVTESVTVFFASFNHRMVCNLPMADYNPFAIRFFRNAL